MHRRSAFVAIVVLVIAACEPTVSARPTTTPPASLPNFRPTAASSQEPSASPAARPTPGATPRHLTAVREIVDSPFIPRFAATGVWTGKEAIVWGGWPWDTEGVSGPVADGAAYDPIAERWRAIPDAPIGGRARHITVWTGREMLVWGGFPESRSRVGAAYDPATRRWRTLAASPSSWSPGAVGAWNGAEWVIAIQRPRTRSIRILAYNPAANAWRELPGLDGPLSEENQLVWTGTDLLLNNVADGLYWLDSSRAVWVHSATTPLAGPVLWVDDRLLGSKQSLDGWSLHAWHRSSDSWLPIQPPGGDLHARGRGLSGFVWTGGLVLVSDWELDAAGVALALDPSSGDWFVLTPEIGLDRNEAVILWAGDRLLMLGGWVGPGATIPFGVAYAPALQG